MGTHIKLLGNTLLCLILMSCNTDKRNQIVSIKDSNFEKALVKRGYDDKLDGLMEVTNEIKKCTDLDIGEFGIQSLEEIKYFTMLKTLKCNNNRISSISLSSNPDLETLDCSGNIIKSLNLTRNLKIEYLDCSNNQFDSLNISELKMLNNLWCENNNMSYLDISKNSKLKKLVCYNNKLTGLYIDYNTELTHLNCRRNDLKSLNLRYNKSLEWLNCSSNELESLDLRYNQSLEWLNCEYNKLKRISIYQNPKLKSIYFDDSVENAEQVEKVIIGNNQVRVITESVEWLKYILITLVVLVFGKIIKYMLKK